MFHALFNQIYGILTGDFTRSRGGLGLRLVGMGGVLFFIFHGESTLAQPMVGAGLLEALSTLNHVSMGEPAGSHGSLGLSLGAGATQHTVGQMGSAQRADLGFASGRASNTELVLPRLWLVKGLPIPVDVGLSVGMSQAPILQQGTGYLQWTVFEWLGLPALAVRLSQSRLYAAQDTSLVSNQVGLAASWDFFQCISVFGSTNLVRHRGTARVDEGGDPGGITLREGEADPHASAGLAHLSVGRALTQWHGDERTTSVGVRLLIIPPFISVTGEWIKSRGKTDTVLAKLSIGI